MKKVKSSNLEHIRYMPESNTLEVKFINGGIYHYSNVDQKTYDAFEEAKSHFYSFTYGPECLTKLT